MKNSLTQKQRRRLDAGITARIRQLHYLRRQLRYVDQEILTAGVELFESEALLGYWLCLPAPALGGKVPLKIMRTAKPAAPVATSPSHSSASRKAAPD